MGVYSKAYMTESDEEMIKSVDTEDLGSDETAEVEIPDSDDIEATAEAVIAANEANYNAIMQSIGISELAVYESTGSEMVYEAANIKGFFGKIKEFFVKLWNKIKGIFKKFFALIASYTMKDKEFVNKYKKDLLRVNTKDFKVKGYEFTNLDLKIKEVAEKIDGIIKTKAGVKSFTDITEDNASVIISNAEKVELEDLKDAMRAASIKGNGSMDDSEFTSELFSYFRKDEYSPVTLDRIDIASLLSIISGTHSNKKTAEDAYKTLEKGINETIKSIAIVEKEALKNTPGENSTTTANNSSIIKAASIVDGYVHAKMNILIKVNGALLRAIKDCNRQAKAICVKALTYKPKNEGFTHYTNEGFLGDVVLR